MHIYYKFHVKRTNKRINEGVDNSSGALPKIYMYSI